MSDTKEKLDELDERIQATRLLVLNEWFEAAKSGEQAMSEGWLANRAMAIGDDCAGVLDRGRSLLPSAPAIADHFGAALHRLRGSVANAAPPRSDDHGSNTGQEDNSRP